MRRSTTAAPTRVYVYGLPSGPVENAASVREQIWLAHRYRNDLTRVELARRDATRMVIATVGDVAALDARIAEAQAEIDAARDAIQQARQQARKRVRDPEAEARTKDLRGLVRTLRAERKEVARQLREDPAIAADLAAIDVRANDMRKALRARCGVYWGTYLLSETAVDAQRREKMDPSFRRWTGEGRIGVQLQGGVPAVALVGGSDTRLQIDQVDHRAWSGTRSERRRSSRTTLRIRIGSEGRAPVWASFPMIMHRPLPTDGIVKQAAVKLERIGTRERWELHITVQAPSFAAELRPVVRRAAINLGWRARPGDAVRVAYVVDDDGREEEILVPADIGDRRDHADSIRGIADREFDAIRAYLREALEAIDVPEWLREDLRYMPQWRAHTKLSRVVIRWNSERFDGDSDVFAAAELWRRQDRHLYQWWTSEAARAEGHRDETYRVTAARLTETYDEITVDGTDLRQLARRARPEDADDQPAGARSNRHRAAPGAFREELVRAAAKRGVLIRVVDPQGLTSHCHACGTACRWEAAAQLHHTCEGCGASWDQDANACHNMLKSQALNSEDETAE